MYFNASWNTFIIYFLSVLTLVTAYEVVKQLTSLILRGDARVSMVTLLISSLYSHFYSFWVYFNIFNDDFYAQFWHQALFTSTELLSTVLVYQMCSRTVALKSRNLLAILTVAVFHILCSVVDNFFQNVVRRGGALNQVVRDLGLMSADLLHFVVCLYLLRQMLSTSQQHITRRDIMVSLGTILLLFCVTRSL